MVLNDRVSPKLDLLDHPVLTRQWGFAANLCKTQGSFFFSKKHIKCSSVKPPVISPLLPCLAAAVFRLRLYCRTIPGL